MDFPFDLSFLNDPHPSDTEVDVKQLAAKIAETNDLVLRIKFLENENKKSDQNILELNSSVEQIKSLYDQERAKFEGLASDNEKLREELLSAESGLNQKHGEIGRLTLLHEQTTAEYDNNLEKERSKYHSLAVQYINQAKLLQEHNLLGSNAKREVGELRRRLLEYNITLPQLLSPKKSSKKKRVTPADKEQVQKCDVGVNCDLIPSAQAKKETVSRATQYVTSTTTRAACTSAFIKTRTIGTNFPEPVPVTLEEALRHTIFEMPAPISPIRDIEATARCHRDSGTQTEICGTASIGSCTKLRNIRKKIKFYDRNGHFPSRIISEDIKKESPMSSTTNLNYASSTLGDIKIGGGLMQPSNPLLDLWNLLGQTIFALMQSGNTALNQSQISLLSERMDACNRHLQLEMTNRFFGAQSFPRGDYFANIPLQNSMRMRLSESSSEDSFSDSCSENWESNGSETVNYKETNGSYANSIFKPFSEELENSVNIQNNVDNSNAVPKISQTHKCNIEDVNHSQIGKEAEPLERDEESGYNSPCDVSNSSRRSVITRTDCFSSSSDNEITNLNHMKQFSSPQEHLIRRLDCKEMAVTSEENSHDTESPPPDEEEFVLALSSGDLDKHDPQEFEEVEKIVEYFSTEKSSDDLEEAIQKSPLKADGKKDRSQESVGDQKLDQKEIFNAEEICSRVEHKNLDNLDNKDEENVKLKSEGNSDTESHAGEGNVITAVDEILKMFSDVAPTQKLRGIKRLKPVKKLESQGLVSKKRVLVRKGGKNCFFPIKNFKERLKKSSKSEECVVEEQLKISNDNSLNLEYQISSNDTETTSELGLITNLSEAELTKVELQSLCPSNVSVEVLNRLYNDVNALGGDLNVSKDCNSCDHTDFIRKTSTSEDDTDKVQRDSEEIKMLNEENAAENKDIGRNCLEQKPTENQVSTDIAEINAPALGDMLKSRKNKKKVRISACTKRVKVEGHCHTPEADDVIKIQESSKDQLQPIHEDNVNNEEVPSHQPSFASFSNVDNILRECILNLSPISRLSESGSDNETRYPLDIRRNLFKIDLFTSESQERQEADNRVIYTPWELDPDSNDSSNDSKDSDFLGFLNGDHLEDSPESPPPYDLEDYPLCDYNTPKLIPLERHIEYDHNYSPLSPCHDTNFDSHPAPVIIPTIRKFKTKENRNPQTMSKLNSALGRILQKFDGAKHNAVAKDRYQIERAPESKQIIKVRQVLEHYILSEAKTIDVDRCMWRLVKRTRCKRILCKAIIEVIEDTKDQICNDLTPPLPVMTETHRKVVVLVDKLNTHVKGFSNNLITAVEQRLFNLKSEKTPLETLINLTLLYIGLIDLQDTEKNPARLFIYKCLYYFNKKAVPMIYYILVSYPAVLPKKSDPHYDRSDAIISSIQCILNSSIYNMEKTELKHREVFHILRLYYEYDRVKPSREEVIENLMAKIKANKFQNVSYSFALVCKHNGVQWTEKEVILKHLLPALTDYYNLVLQSDAHDLNASVLLECLSFILKPFPLDYSVERYLQIFTNFLHATDRKVVQEAAVSAVLRIQRFGCVDCFNIICNWNPSFRIDSNLRLMLRSFVHRKPVNFWKKLENQI